MKRIKIRRLATIEYHETRTGNIIFDYIYDTKEEE